MVTNEGKRRFKLVPPFPFVFVILVSSLLGVLVLFVMFRTGSWINLGSWPSMNSSPSRMNVDYTSILIISKQNSLSIQLREMNLLPPRNMDLFPELANDRIVIVLYVHDRPHYLRVVVESLSKVDGINETLLIVSHDGYFEAMNEIVESIRFCQVKQIFSPFSPHVLSDTFPGTSHNDCKNKDVAEKMQCVGNPDQYGNHRSPKFVSLKHHWWWMMNTVWDGLEETRGHMGDVLFIEEDHFILPNAYRNLQVLTSLKSLKCPFCYFANLAPRDVTSRGENWDYLVAERMGNVGYSFNHTVWRKIHAMAKEFCFFDDYNWDITLWVAVYPSLGSLVYTIRGPRTSAIHFGSCGLHQGHGNGDVCAENGAVDFQLEDADKAANINSSWKMYVADDQSGYQAGFRGWGGWGDKRDHDLCLHFATMAHSAATKRSSSP